MRQLLVKENDKFGIIQIDDPCTREQLTEYLESDKKLSLEHLYFNGVECRKPLEYYPENEPCVAIVTRFVNVKFHLASDESTVSGMLEQEFKHSDRIYDLRSTASTHFKLDYIHISGPREKHWKPIPRTLTNEEIDMAKSVLFSKVNERYGFIEQ